MVERFNVSLDLAVFVVDVQLMADCIRSWLISAVLLAMNRSDRWNSFRLDLNY